MNPKKELQWSLWVIPKPLTQPQITYLFKDSFKEIIITNPILINKPTQKQPEEVTSIDEFWSHSWHGRVSSKVWLLLMLKNLGLWKTF